MTASARKHALSAPDSAPELYSLFTTIDGTHPWKKRVPTGYIEYEARILRDAKIAYFNFTLAKEMGLIPESHPNSLNAELEKKIIETFSLRIINEYDQLNGIQFSKKDIKPGKYMATRYLQLQHSSKLGTTSGDGRSMWNGSFNSPSGAEWDISSCGTGVTRLSPGSVFEGKPIKTGDKKVSYGSGLADIDEGLTAAILSESFHARGMFTERTLAIVDTKDGHAINIRAAKNLLRPSHLFLHLKQGNQLQLKAAIDTHIDRELRNKNWPRELPRARQYDHLLDTISKNYGEFAARLEDEYIFCWLDWDGDNMLISGGIIDYGSIRQLGLCHHLYRYDDVTRFSTNLKEQKIKAKYLVQTFAQMIHFVRTGEKKEIRAFAESEHIKKFWNAYTNSKALNFLQRVGFDSPTAKYLQKNHSKLCAKLYVAYEYFERKESARGEHRTPDGVNCEALFDIRNILRELPKHYLTSESLLHSADFINLIRTPFCTKALLKNHKKFQPKVTSFQTAYLDLVRASSKSKDKTGIRKRLLEMTMRSSHVNRNHYITGDGIIYAVDLLLKRRKNFSPNAFIQIVDAFIAHQCGRPAKALSKKSEAVLLELIAIAKENQYSL